MKRNRFAIGVGINHYFGSGKNELTGCHEDVKTVMGLLKNQYNEATEFDVEEHIDEVKSSLKTQITTDALRALVGKVFNPNRKLEVALFYFAGHGAPGKSEREFYLLSSDAKRPEHGMPMREVLDAANQCDKIQERIVILDCCHSGHMGDMSVGDGKMTSISDGVTILAACGKREEAMELEHSGGLFTRLLVEALEGGAADVLGCVTLASIYNFIDLRLNMAQQRPVFKASLSRLVSLRMCPPLIVSKILKKSLATFSHPDEHYSLNHSHESEIDESKRKQPFNPEAGKVFRGLQDLRAVGLVEPVGHKDMYWAAFHCLSCRLTLTGKLYWHTIIKR